MDLQNQSPATRGQSATDSVAPAYVRLKAAAAYTGLSEQMILKMHRMGDGPPRIMKGRAVLYSLRALDEWMDRDQIAA